MANNKAKEKSQQQREQIVEAIIDLCASGKLDWNKTWNPSGMSPHNPVSKTRYRGVNRIYLALAAAANGYKDPRWVTFNQAKAQGWKMPKGTHAAAYVEKWGMVTPKAKDNEPSEDDKDKDSRSYYCLQSCYPVYNVEQLEGVPELKIETRGAGEVNEDIEAKADAFIATSRCEIVEHPLNEAACYNPYSDKIEMPDRRNFVSDAEFAATLFHEMAHSTAHKDTPIFRDVKHAFGTKEYALEELRAELAAIFIEADLGFTEFGEVRENHAAYLQSWDSDLDLGFSNRSAALKRFGETAGENERKELSNIISISDRIADYLIQRAQPELAKLQPLELKGKEQTITAMAETANDAYQNEQKEVSMESELASTR